MLFSEGKREVPIDPALMQSLVYDPIRDFRHAARLAGEIGKALDAPDTNERLRTMGSETPSVRTPEASTAFIETEKALYARLVKVSGAKPDRVSSYTGTVILIGARSAPMLDLSK